MNRNTTKGFGVFHHMFVDLGTIPPFYFPAVSLTYYVDKPKLSSTKFARCRKERMFDNKMIFKATWKKLSDLYKVLVNKASKNRHCC